MVRRGAHERLSVEPGVEGFGEAAAADALAWIPATRPDILELIGEGLTNRRTGDRLHLAEKTIKNYVSILLSGPGVQHLAGPALMPPRAGGEKRSNENL